MEEEYANAIDSLTSNGIGINLFDEEIDDIILRTNEFLTDATFSGENGPFWYILQMCMALGALFAILMAAGMAYKMIVKGEGFDPIKILRVLGIALVMEFWYGNPVEGFPNEQASTSEEYVFDGGVLDALAFIPNCIGSYCHDLYEAEADVVQKRYNDLMPLIKKRDDETRKFAKEAQTAKSGVVNSQSGTAEVLDPEDNVDSQKDAHDMSNVSIFGGIMIFLDKIVMFLALVAFRIGWWGTIYCQQILLGMLTIFGPIMWAFSILPKWEGAWAKWISRYLTVQFYGAMLYFVGFYVLLLFDIVISVQINEMSAFLSDPDSGTFNYYIQNTFLTAGYLLVASIVSLKCLNLVPDLAAWMIPEGDTAFSTRNFGEGVADAAKRSAMSLGRM